MAYLAPWISRKHAHFVYGVIQSGLTAAISSGVANIRLPADGAFIVNWTASWLTSWALMTPIVVFAAPVIRRIAISMTRE